MNFLLAKLVDPASHLQALFMSALLQYVPHSVFGPFGKGIVFVCHSHCQQKEILSERKPSPPV